MENINKRANLRHNFLKNIILRLDFEKVPETFNGEFLLKMKEFLLEKGFDRYEEKNANQINIELRKITNNNSDSVSGNINSHKVYEFINNDNGYTVQLSTTCIIMNINSIRYEPFEKYSDLLVQIYSKFQENFAFFTPKRFGVRKINVCILDSISKIDHCFNNSLFNLYNNVTGVFNLASSKRFFFMKNNLKVNLNCDVRHGKHETADLYRIVLDIDTYTDVTADINSQLAMDEPCKDMNELIFDVYKTSLTKEFYDCLCQDEFTLDGVIGVEEND